MKLLSGTIVFGFGIFLICLSIICVFFPSKAEKFLSAFASSAKTHFLEMGFRLIVGVGLIFFAAEMRFPTFFSLFGWVMIFTTVILMLMPWRIHQKFSQMSVPPIILHLKLFAFASFLFGVFIFFSLSKVFFSE